MKRLSRKFNVFLLLFSLAAGLLIIPAGKPALAASSYSAYITAGKAYIHTGPGTWYHSVGVYYSYQTLTVTGRSGNWDKVTYGGHTRYVWAGSVRAGSPRIRSYVTPGTIWMRSGPGLKYGRIRYLYQNYYVTIYSRSGNWYRVNYAGKMGYAWAGSIRVGVPPFQSYNGFVNVPSLYLRTDPGLASSRITVLSQNTPVTVFGKSGNWYRVKYGTTTGYSWSGSITPGNPPLDYTPVNAYTAYIGYDYLSIYQQPSSGSGIVTTLRERTPVSVIGVAPNDSSWLKINYNGTQGFISKDNVTTNFSTFSPPAGVKYGIDISHYQGTVDFNAVKNAGNSFVIIKSSESNNITDSNFASYVQQAKGVGLQVNSYHFFHARTPQDAVNEADFYVSVLNAAGITDSNSFGYTFLDVEAKSGSTVLFDGINPQQMSANINAFMNEMKAKGFTKLGLYSNKSFFESNIDASQLENGLLLWLARYRGMDSNQGIGTQVDLWQYTSNGSVSGISGSVDLDVDYSNNF